MTAPREGGLTLDRWVADVARLRPDHVAVLDRGVALTYRELDERADRLRRTLLAAGYRHGDRIATLTGNSADHVVLFFACARAGLVLVPLSWRLTATELTAQLELADPACLLAEEELLTPARGAARRLAVRLPVESLGEAGIERRAPAPARPQPGSGPHGLVGEDDPLLMVFTSGTGGPAKAAVLTHGGCTWTNLSLGRVVGLAEGDVVLAVLPQFHAGGWNIQPLLAWWTGATVVLERTFDAGRALRLIAEHRVSTMMAVPTQYLLMAEHRDFAGTDLSSLRRAVVGGSPMPPALLRIYHGRGVALTQGYGLTEAGPNVLCVPPHDARERVGSAGKPYPHVDVALADPATGEHLLGAGTGELLVRGPGMFAGYFRDPEATAALWRDGWLATGDVATRDEQGWFTIVDRLKNIYISGGENVAPAQVEQVLRRHPAVADAVVVGVPDPRWGEVGVALVVPRGGVPWDEHELLEHCRELLAAYKVPTRVVAVDELPYVGLDKVSREGAARIALAAVGSVGSEHGEGVRHR